MPNTDHLRNRRSRLGSGNDHCNRYQTSRGGRGKVTHGRCLTAPGVAVLVPVLVGCTASTMTRVPDVPAALGAPSSQVLSAELHASGVQIYSCNPNKDDPTRFGWVFDAPEADLLDRSGKRIGRHYAGPTWEANDGSSVVGTVIARDDGPDPTAIPWLLLHATSTTGHGIFSKTQSVQRLHTVGGKAPADGCDRTQSGKQVRVPYTAEYRFYVLKQGEPSKP